MRTVMVLSAGALMTASLTGMATAQAPGAPYPHGGQSIRVPMPQAPRVPVMQRQQRWGSQIGGRWWGGANAPGGWAAYRQPYRGYRVPTYWVAPRFYVTDWSRYGLYQPSGGHNWVRYYDDAILVDRSGNVNDWRGGLNWDAYDRSEETYYEGADQGSEGHDGHDQRRGSTGVGGAVAGAVVGGVVGNVVAGRGNRLGGTLIGAGVGAAAGYGIDRAANRDRDRREPPPVYREPAQPLPPPNRDGDWRDGGDYRSSGARRQDRRVIVMRRDGGAGYPPPMGPRGGPYGGPRGGYESSAGANSWTSADGGTVVTTTTGGVGGPAPVIVGPSDGGYYGGTTTVTVQSGAVVTTTTTTETIEDAVTYRAPTVRRAAVRARTWHARPRVKTRPRCNCR